MRFEQIVDGSLVGLITLAEIPAWESAPASIVVCVPKIIAALRFCSRAARLGGLDDIRTAVLGIAA